jgi:hypothetical protein
MHFSAMIAQHGVSLHNHLAGFDRDIEVYFKA